MNETPKHQFHLLILILAVSLVFLVNYNFTGDYLNNSDDLSHELRSPIGSIYQYKLANDVPFRYRILFPQIVHYTWVAVRSNSYDNRSFIMVYRGWSYVLYVTSAVTFSLLLRVMGFSRPQALAGGMIFIALPPMSFAFTFPVHTREDLLAYTLLNLALIFLLKGKDLSFMLTAIAGEFCRETVLTQPILSLF